MLQIYKSFPDIQSNSWGYSVDPQEPNRVWFFVRCAAATEPELPQQLRDYLKGCAPLSQILCAVFVM